MNQTDRNQRYYQLSVPQSLIGLLAGIFLLILLACSPAQKSTGPGQPVKGCGHCQEMPASQVCTPEGTRRNSCLAICEGIRIECFEACPCPTDDA